LKTRPKVFSGLSRLALVLVGSAALCGVQNMPARAADAETPQVRAERLVRSMTLEEKLSLVEGDVALQGVGTGFNPCVGHLAGVPRLGVPPLCFGDGPEGVGNGARDVTQFPAPIAGAAAWDVDLLRAFGEAMADEHIGKGRNVVLGPTLNILRTPRWGRAAESLGEDPFLTAQLGVAVIGGMQSRGVIADAKHFAANNQETERFGASPDYRAIDARVDERALQEIYYPAFKAAVQAGGVGSVMCAYNKVNGVQACENAPLLSALRDWGFSGFVVADWYFAARSTTPSALAGLDVSMPGGDSPFGLPDVYGPPLRRAVEDGRAPTGVIDRMAIHVLTPMIQAGLLDRPPRGDAASDVRSPAHTALARRIAVEGAVLLKNQGVLPLRSSDRTIAVIGDDADAGAATSEAYGGFVAYDGLPVSRPLAALRARAGSAATIAYACGTLGVGALPTLRPLGGFQAAYFPTPDLSGPPAVARTEPVVDLAKAPVEGLGKAWSARWTGRLTPSGPGLYRFSLSGGGSARLYVDGRLAANLFKSQFREVVQGVVRLDGAHPVDLRLEYEAGPTILAPRLSLGGATPGDSLIDAAVALARKSDVAVVFAGDAVSEGADRTDLTLPGDQDALIEAVAAANPRTIVVLNTVGPVLMPWLGKVAGVVEAWYPGEQDGAAIAALLFGDENFSGKLPQTFPADESQGPGATAETFPGVNGEVRYAEGVDVGYRFYDVHHQVPLFAFGFGLSYSKFHLGGLNARPDASGGLDVEAEVTNMGPRSGAQVPQLYLGFPSPAGEPPWQLKGFQRVSLEVGQTAKVRLHLKPEDFEVFDVQGGKWTPVHGTFALKVADDSRDGGLETEVTR